MAGAPAYSHAHYLKQKASRNTGFFNYKNL